MEELRQTFEKLTRKLLGSNVDKFLIKNKIEEFFSMKGIENNEYAVDIKRKYVYVRVESPYLRQEMSMMKEELANYLKENKADNMYAIKFTGRK